MTRDIQTANHPSYASFLWPSHSHHSPFPLVFPPPPTAPQPKMGKSQTKKKLLAKSRRHNPIRVPDTHLPHGRDIVASGSGATNGAAAAGSGVGAAVQGGKGGKVRGEEVIPVIAKLSSPSPTDRSWACAAISTLISNDPGTRRLFLGKGVIGVLVGLLQRGLGGPEGEEGEVLVEAVGALR